MRRFAQDTSVPISRSREQIDELLRAWKCEGVAWIDHWAEDKVEMQFRMLRLDQRTNQATVYVARFVFAIESQEKIRQRCMGSRGLKQAQFDQEMSRRGRREHRVLLLMLKGALEAVEEGIIPPEALFLAFMVCSDGRTVYEAAIDQLPQLVGRPAAKALPAITGETP